MTPKELWDAALISLRNQFTEQVWARWLQGSTVLYQKGDEITVRVVDEYAVEWCDARLRAAIDRTVQGLARYEGMSIRRVRFTS